MGYRCNYNVTTLLSLTQVGWHNILPVNFTVYLGQAFGYHKCTTQLNANADVWWCSVQQLLIYEVTNDLTMSSIAKFYLDINVLRQC